MVLELFTICNRDVYLCGASGRLGTVEKQLWGVRNSSITGVSSSQEVVFSLASICSLDIHQHSFPFPIYISSSSSSFVFLISFVVFSTPVVPLELWPPLHKVASIFVPTYETPSLLYTLAISRCARNSHSQFTLMNKAYGIASRREGASGKLRYTDSFTGYIHIQRLFLQLWSALEPPRIHDRSWFL